MKRKTEVAVIFSLFAWMPLWRSAGAEATAELTIASMYVDRGLQLGDLTAHPSIEVGAGDAYFGLWAAAPLENTGAPDFFGDELELYGGYGFALGDKVAADLGASYTEVEGDGDSWEGYFGVLGELGTLTPAFYIYRDFDLKTYTFELSTGVALPLEGFPAETSVRLGRVTGDVDYTYYEVDLVYPIALSDDSRLAFGLHYAGNDVGSGVADNRLYGSAAFRLAF